MPDPLVTAFGTYEYDVVDHIVRWADANNLPPLAQLAMGLQESNLDPQAEGDVAIGGSYGVYQIYVQAHGGPPSRWLGIDGLDASMEEMRARWQAAFATEGSWEAWLADPIAFQQGYAPAAQGSIGWTHAMAAERVGQAIVLLVLYLRALVPVPKPAPTKAWDDPARFALIGYVAGGSGPRDIEQWTGQYQ